MDAVFARKDALIRIQDAYTCNTSMAVALPQCRKDWIWLTWTSWCSCDTCCRPNLLAFFKRLHFSVWALSRFDPAGLQDELSLLTPAHRESGVSSSYFLINVHLASLHCFDKQKPCIVPCSPLKACISFPPLPHYTESTFCKCAAHALSVMTFCPRSNH